MVRGKVVAILCFAGVISVLANSWCPVCSVSFCKHAINFLKATGPLLGRIR